jgi:hypothetical protein
VDAIAGAAEMSKELFTKSEFDSKREHLEYNETVRCASWLKGEIYHGRNIMRTQRPFPMLLFSHFPGEGKDAAEGFFLKRMGVREGIHDFLFCWPPAQCGFMELKVKGKTQRSSQVGFDMTLAEFGFKHRAVCYTTEEVRDKLIAFGVPGYIPVPIPSRKLTHAEQLQAQYEWSRPS